MTKKTRLIPFDYDKYKAGAKAKCNDIYVYDLHLFSCNHPYPLVGVIDNCLVSFTQDGKTNLHHGNDLMLEVELEEKTFYVNVYNDAPCSKWRGIHATYEHAKDEADLSCLKGILKVTYTDEDLIK